MTCRGCNEKTSRYTGLPRMTRDVDEARAGTGFMIEDPLGGQEVEQGKSPDPITTFLAARNLSYEDIISRKNFQRDILLKQAEAVMDQMTDAMRQVHIDELIGVVNCDKMAVPGMSPGQAIMALRQCLDRKEFSFVDELYPGLREAVDEQHAKIQANSLPRRKKE